MELKGFWIKDIYFSKSIATTSMTFSIPIFGSGDDRENIAGILVTRINLQNSLYKLLLNRVGLGSTGETLIVNKDVIAMNNLRWSNAPPLTQKISAEPALLASQGKSGITATTDYRGESILAAYTYVPETKWGFVCKQDMHELNEPIRAMIRNSIFIFFAISIIIALIALYISRSISKPIVEVV